MIEPTSGKVLYNHEDSLNRGGKQMLIGYVPQDDIVHKSLTVDKAFLYSYFLRVKPGENREAARRRVREVLSLLDLSGRADTKIKKLSGGERKRVNLGIELLTDPRVLFLDEPTSGLDPYLERQMMKQFRKLTSSQRALLVTTHRLANVNLFDLVIFLSKGYLVFGGTPQDALEFFQVSDHELIYGKLRLMGPPRLADRFRQSVFYPKFETRSAPHIASPKESGGQESKVDQELRKLKERMEQ